MPRNLKKMQAPAGVSEANIEGQLYEPDKNGQIEVLQDGHIETLRRHGFTDVVESSETEDDIMKMDREELEDYIEERGGNVEGDPKTKVLRAQALRAGGFLEAADRLAPLDPSADQKPQRKRRKK